MPLPLSRTYPTAKGWANDQTDKVQVGGAQKRGIRPQRRNNRNGGGNARYGRHPHEWKETHRGRVDGGDRAACHGIPPQHAWFVIPGFSRMIDDREKS